MSREKELVFFEIICPDFVSSDIKEKLQKRLKGKISLHPETFPKDESLAESHEERARVLLKQREGLLENLC